MSMAAVRKRYRVPAKRGMRIIFDGKPCTITSASRAGLTLYVRFDSGQVACIHPTWEVQYPQPNERESATMEGNANG